MVFADWPPATGTDADTATAGEEVAFTARCARCDGWHDTLRVYRFRRPVCVAQLMTIAPVKYRWWALCPTTGEPVLIPDVERDL